MNERMNEQIKLTMPVLVLDLCTGRLNVMQIVHCSIQMRVRPFLGRSDVRAITPP